MTLGTRAVIEEIAGRAIQERQLANGEDISGGVETTIGNVSKWSLFLDVGGAVEVTIEFSPDGGTTWYAPRDESPIVFSGANTDVFEIGYAADRVRLTGSNNTNVTAQAFEVA